MFKIPKSILFFLCIYSPPFFNLPTYSIYALLLSIFFTYDYLSQKLVFSFKSVTSYLFALSIFLVLICLFYNFFDNSFHDPTSIIFASLIIPSFLSPSFTSFFRNILQPSQRIDLIKGFFLFSIILSFPSVLQFLRLDFGLFDFAYTSDMLLVKTTGYRFPGIMNMYGALASTVIATYITFLLYLLKSTVKSIHTRRIYFLSMPLLLSTLLFSGSTGLFFVFLYFLIFSFRFFALLGTSIFFLSPALLSIPLIAKSGLSYILKLLAFDPNINLFTSGTLGYMFSMYFSDQPEYLNFISRLPILGGLPTFYTSVGTDVGYFNLVGVYGVFSVILFYSLILYLVYSLRRSPYFSFSIFLSISCILLNFKEVYFLSSPGPFRLILILSLANMPPQYLSPVLSTHQS